MFFSWLKIDGILWFCFSSHQKKRKRKSWIWLWQPRSHWCPGILLQMFDILLATAISGAPSGRGRNRKLLVCCRLPSFSIFSHYTFSRPPLTVNSKEAAVGGNQYVCLFVGCWLFFFWKVEEGGKKGKKEGKERKSGSSSARCGCQVTVGFHLSTPPPPSFPRVSECVWVWFFHRFPSVRKQTQRPGRGEKGNKTDNGETWNDGNDAHCDFTISSLTQWWFWWCSRVEASLWSLPTSRICSAADWSAGRWEVPMKWEPNRQKQTGGPLMIYHRPSWLC